MPARRRAVFVAHDQRFGQGSRQAKQCRYSGLTMAWPRIYNESTQSAWGLVVEISIQKWGNSAAVRLSATLLEQLGVALGDKLEVEVLPEGVMLRPARHRYALADLIAQCDPKAPLPGDAEAWNNRAPAGHEIW